MTELEAKSAIPLYRQLAEKIRGDYVEHYSSIDEDGPIPSEQELMSSYGVSRITVRNAVNELVKEGILQKIQGKGTFITGLTTYPMNHPGGFSRSCALMHIAPSTKLIDMKMIPASGEEQEFFHLKKGEKILRIKRLRLGDGKPLILERLYVPEKYKTLTREEWEDSFYKILEKEHGVIVNKGPRWIELHHADADDAALMALVEGDPLIYMQECGYDKVQRPLHSTKLLIRPDFRLYLN